MSGSMRSDKEALPPAPKTSSHRRQQQQVDQENNGRSRSSMRSSSRGRGLKERFTSPARRSQRKGGLLMRLKAAGGNSTGN